MRAEGKSLVPNKEIQMKYTRNFVAVALVAGAVALAGAPKTAHADNIAEVAMGSSQFSTLVKAVKAAGLAPALMGHGPLTVFAPTNAAFAKLPAGTLQMLLKPENKATLASILKYHVIPGRVTARNVMRLPSGSNVNTLNGEGFAVRRMGGKVMLDAFGSKANVVKTDLRADNGVIHVIDSVILPPSVLRAMARNGG
jgi:transforming growth factor-beta-induced protein